ncbi:head closure Hc2 [Synechococcus phage S-CAM7]|uniref:Neck protein n=1 Tax=Synechococcus phage S-CAM7 TaxID=1883368 RepID=A0A1D8KTR0_9CAUD|nr:head closure Hc2 [Synechococcus phage S-CAM7]AOV62058.1 hypothetical protein C490910_134 [Synechococcus phage S-CAM7]QLF86185.1 neck protein [Synechococcus phage S-CAM7]
MVVNPFFLHGSTQEQNLQQDLINEQIRMYGMDVYYIPRNFVREATIMREVTSSAFRSYFIIEAYLNNFDGYGGQGDIMSKFGIQVKDEITLTLSRERYENYIAPFLNSRMLYLMNSAADDGALQTIQRPREGDLIYFPLGRRLFEIKYVEHEQPFYQLGTGYTYELQCELFEYEDEILNTSIDEIDTTIINKGFINTLNLVPLSNRAEVTANLGTGYIRELVILNEGNNFRETPSIYITPPPEGGVEPNVVALLTKADSNIIEPAIKQLVTFSSGSGYIEDPEAIAVGGGGEGSIIRATINTESLGIIDFEVTNAGAGYPEDAAIIVYDKDNNPVAEGLALTDGEKIVSAIIKNPGADLKDDINVVVSAPATSGEGAYLYNEIIIGKESGMQARVRGWNAITCQLEVTNLDPEKNFVNFQTGEIIEGEKSGARYSLKNFNSDQTPADGFSQNDGIQEEADVVVDTSEYNQFFDPNQDYFSSDNPFGE